MSLNNPDNYILEDPDNLGFEESNDSTFVTVSCYTFIYLLKETGSITRISILSTILTELKT